MLAELLVATSLLTATLKFDGDITVTAAGRRSDEIWRLLTVTITSKCAVWRACRTKFKNADLKTLVGNGYVVITITLSEGERYQGVVGLEGDTTAACTGRLLYAF